MQASVEERLKDVAEFVKKLKKEQRKDKLREELRKMTWPARFPLPLDPRLECCGLVRHRTAKQAPSPSRRRRSTRAASA